STIWLGQLSNDDRKARQPPPGANQPRRGEYEGRAEPPCRRLSSSYSYGESEAYSQNWLGTEYTHYALLRWPPVWSLGGTLVALSGRREMESELFGKQLKDTKRMTT